VVDGFTSRKRLSEYPAYLNRIERRGELEKEREGLYALREQKVRVADGVLKFGGTGAGAAAIFGWGWLLIRQRGLRGQAVAQLRNQIARDLHDDIGSNLGGIVLLSEIGSRHCENEQAREDFKTIREAAETTSQSMQDIVWLIERENFSLRELVTRMRRSAEALLGESRIALKVSPDDFPDRPLSLFFRRHVFFAFKETINNVRRHSAATAVVLRIWIDPDELRFEVRDNGCGFDPESASQSGNGLANLRRRAGRVKGGCNITSSPGNGTLVNFYDPFKASSKSI
jgi:signal transduction histidine kinase